MQEACRALCETYGHQAKLMFQPLRAAVCGNMVKPSVVRSIELLNREDVLARIDATLAAAFLMSRPCRQCARPRALCVVMAA